MKSVNLEMLEEDLKSISFLPSVSAYYLSPWGGVNFINPPYSRKLKELFVKRAILESKKGAICVLLLPVSTSTALFHDFIKPNAKEIRFVRGRIAFCGVNTKGEYTETGKPMHDSMIVIF